MTDREELFTRILAADKLALYAVMIADTDSTGNFSDSTKAELKRAIRFCRRAQSKCRIKDNASGVEMFSKGADVLRRELEKRHMVDATLKNFSKLSDEDKKAALQFLEVLEKIQAARRS